MAMYRKPAAHAPKPSSAAADEEDAFVAATLRASQWTRRNNKAVVLLLGIVAASVVAAIYYANHRRALRADAAAQLEILQQRIDAGQLDGVRNDLEVFLDRYGGTPQAPEARIALALALVGAGELESAAERLEPMARDVGDPLGAQAAAFLAAVFEDMGNATGAEALYMRLADQAELDFHVREGLAAAARMRQARGDHAGALALYDRLLESPGDLGPDLALMELRRSEAASALR